MNAASIDIKDIIESESSLGLEFASNLFIGKIPKEPKNCVTIIDTPGSHSLSLDSSNYERPSVQITVRNTKYDVGYNIAYGIMTSLHGRAQETWNGTLYSIIQCSSGPAFLEWDENGNAKFVINFNIQRR